MDCALLTVHCWLCTADEDINTNKKFEFKFEVEKISTIMGLLLELEKVIEYS
jgi:hypothetical protein